MFRLKERMEKKIRTDLQKSVLRNSRKILGGWEEMYKLGF
jgi:hypothetical protein